MFELLGAALNLVALLLFVIGYRAPRARHAERAASWCAAVTVGLCVVGPSLRVAGELRDWTEAYVSGTTYVAWAMSPLARLLLVRGLFVRALLVPIPLAAWLGLVALRRSRSAASGACP